MQVRFSITAREMREARRLAQAKRTRSSISIWVWACLVIPLVGSFGDLIREVRQAKGVSISGSVLPEILLVAAVVLTAFLVLRLRRGTSMKPGLSAAGGEVAMSFREDGLHCFEVDAGVADEECLRWESFQDVRVGKHVLVLLYRHGRRFEAISQSAMTEEQLQRLQRLLARKLRPQKIPAPVPQWL